MWSVTKAFSREVYVRTLSRLTFIYVDAHLDFLFFGLCLFKRMLPLPILEHFYDLRRPHVLPRLDVMWHLLSIPWVHHSQEMSQLGSYAPLMFFPWAGCECRWCGGDVLPCFETFREVGCSSRYWTHFVFTSIGFVGRSLFHRSLYLNYLSIGFGFPLMFSVWASVRFWI